MVKVKKSNFWTRTHAADADPYQEFEINKIKMALVRAGARSPNVEKIANKIKPIEGMTTDDIDNIVVAELEKRDPLTAKYWKIMRDYRKSRFMKTR